MAFSSATKKLQQVVDMAEDVYTRLDGLREEIDEVRERVERTDDRVERMERTLEGQLALIRALAEEEGIEVEPVLTDAAIDEAEGDTAVLEAHVDAEETESMTDGPSDDA